MSDMEKFQQALGWYVIGATITYLIQVVVEVSRNEQPTPAVVYISLAWPLFWLTVAGITIGNALKPKAKS